MEGASKGEDLGEKEETEVDVGKGAGDEGEAEGAEAGGGRGAVEEVEAGFELAAAFAVRDRPKAIKRLWGSAGVCGLDRTKAA